MISDLVSGKADTEKMKCKSDDFFQQFNAEAIMNKKVTALNLTEKTLSLEGGEKVTYEKLLLATGGKPFVPKMEGQEKDGVFTFTTITDAERLISKRESLIPLENELIMLISAKKLDPNVASILRLIFDSTRRILDYSRNMSELTLNRTVEENCSALTYK